MKLFFIISLFFLSAKLHAQTDSAKSTRIRYYAVSIDSMRLSVANAKQVTIKQFKDHNTIIIYSLAEPPKNKLDTILKKHK